MSRRRCPNDRYVVAPDQHLAQFALLYSSMRADLCDLNRAYSSRVTTWWRAWRRRWAALAAIAGFVMAAVYLALIASEGNNGFGEVVPWALAMLVAAVLSLIAAHTEVDQRARVLLFVSAATFLAIGVVSIFSLGLGFLAAGAMALFAANEIPRSSRN